MAFKLAMCPTKTQTEMCLGSLSVVEQRWALIRNIRSNLNDLRLPIAIAYATTAYTATASLSYLEHYLTIVSGF